MDPHFNDIPVSEKTIEDEFEAARMDGTEFLASELPEHVRAFFAEQRDTLDFSK